jgi:hypothetical protein
MDSQTVLIPVNIHQLAPSVAMRDRPKVSHGKTSYVAPGQ